jgi:hypothetical protein
LSVRAGVFAAGAAAFSKKFHCKSRSRTQSARGGADFLATPVITSLALPYIAHSEADIERGRELSSRCQGAMPLHDAPARARCLR